ncbi:hypothetical protein HDV06_001195 [Boothiomyces sp. JEL0866]|nr:hypothetical protein HDV06_001195 [Boothiomyces sp. JEL0866]
MEELKIVVGGIPVSFYSIPSKPASSEPLGIFFLHGRLWTSESTVKRWEKYLLEVLDSFPDKVYLIAFDQRNHGERMANEIHNQGKEENPNHALDMFAIQYGTAKDVSYLIDCIPLFVDIQKWWVFGFSLGGHATLLSLTVDERLQLGISIVGCGDYATLMKMRDLPVSPALQNLLNQRDPINNIDRLAGRRLLCLNGGADNLVQAAANNEFAKLLEGDSFSYVVDPDAKHELSALMKAKIKDFFVSNYKKTLNANMSYEINPRTNTANAAKKHPALPGKLPKLDVVSVEARSVHLSWYISPLYEGFQFQITKAELDILEFETVYEGEGPQCEIGGLKPQTNYQFKLRFQSPADRNNGIWSTEHTEISVTTPDESAVVKASNSFMRAVVDNDPGKVKSILEEFGKQISLEARDKNGRTLLMIAAQNDSVDIIKQLLSAGADPHATTIIGKTALSIAVAFGNKAAFETLLSFDKTLLDCSDTNGSTLLMWAAESAPQAARKGSASDIINILLSYKVDVNKEDLRGYTALDRLCMTSGSAEAAATLIKAGAKIVHHCDKKHTLTSLMTAAMNGHTELCKELIETFGVDKSVKSEVTIS